MSSRSTTAGSRLHSRSSSRIAGMCGVSRRCQSMFCRPRGAERISLGTRLCSNRLVRRRVGQARAIAVERLQDIPTPDALHGWRNGQRLAGRQRPHSLPTASRNVAQIPDQAGSKMLVVEAPGLAGPSQDARRHRGND